MLKVINIELKKAIKTKYFISAILIGVLISIIGLVYNVKLVQENVVYEGMNPCIEACTLFNHWIGGEGFSLGSSLYFFVYPLIIAIPYGWSFCCEKTSGYMRQMIIRTGKVKYLFAKYVATFISGGLAMVIPLITNFMMTALFVPALRPVPTYDTSYGVFGVSMFSKYYYTHPYMYVGLYLLVDFVFCGALASLTMLSAQFIKYKWINCIFPFVVCMGINVVDNMLHSNDITTNYYQVSPFYFTRGMQTGYPARLSIIMGIVFIMILLVTTVNVVWIRRKDIM